MDVSSIVHAKFAASNPLWRWVGPIASPPGLFWPLGQFAHHQVLDWIARFESPMFIYAFYDLTSSSHSISTRACRCSHAMPALSDIRKCHICFGPKRTFGICQYPFK